MHKRSGVGRKPVVQSIQSRSCHALDRASSATITKSRTWLTTKQHSRRDGNPVASVLYHDRANCSPGSMSPQALVIVQDCHRVALQVAILSGFPTITTSSFSHCPISGRIPVVVAHHRRARQIPRPRDDIPHISRLTSSIPPPGPDVIPNFDL